MKKKIKTWMFGFIVGAIIFSSIGVVASGMLASDISFVPDDKNWKVSNVNDAINDLYENKKISSGEAFLIVNGTSGYTLTHNYVNSYSANYDIYDLDFNNIKEFTYTYTLTTNNNTYQYLKLYNDDNYFLNITGTSSGTVVIDGARNVNFSNMVSYSATGVFKINSYTTMGGEIYTFD